MYSFSRYKEQYRANLKLALPVVMTQVGQILVQFADNAMVGQFGGDDPLPLAAVSFGGAVFFILFVTGMGLTLGLTPLVGERFAQGDKRGAADYLKKRHDLLRRTGFSDCRRAAGRHSAHVSHGTARRGGRPGDFPTYYGVHGSFTSSYVRVPVRTSRPFLYRSGSVTT